MDVLTFLRGIYCFGPPKDIGAAYWRIFEGTSLIDLSYISMIANSASNAGAGGKSLNTAQCSGHSILCRRNPPPHFIKKKLPVFFAFLTDFNRFTF